MTTLGIAHDRTICHCSHCERRQRSYARRLFLDALLKSILVGFAAYFIGHVLVWAVKGFPGLMRIG